MKRVIVLSTGNELLYGNIPDTNSAFISGRLFPLDLRVVLHVAAGDDTGELEHSIRFALENADIVIMTGGLGPTDDDNTLAALGRICGAGPVIDGTARERMEAFFGSMGMPFKQSDLKMAEVPAGSMVLTNTRGLAPGFILKINGKIIVAMPGVPAEMMEMMDRSVLPYLVKEYGLTARAGASFRIIAMKESDINETVRSMDLPFEKLDWGMTAREGITTVTFVENGSGPVDFTAVISDASRRFGARFLGPEYSHPAEEVLRIMGKTRMTLSCAESCTGGLISRAITDIPGASDVFTGSVVAYSNRIKVSQLGVSEESLTRYGAVSEQVAAEMASGARTVLVTDIGISTTGIAGPGGGSEAKPVGLVWFGLSDKNGVKTFSRHISGGRERVRNFASLIAIDHLRGYLKELTAL
jgi:nicotinamide-nucleotide amidase